MHAPSAQVFAVISSHATHADHACSPNELSLQVDQKGVLDYKSSKLQAAGVGMQAGQPNVAYPLKAASYTAVQAGW